MSKSLVSMNSTWVGSPGEGLKTLLSNPAMQRDKCSPGPAGAVGPAEPACGTQAEKEPSAYECPLLGNIIEHHHSAR